MAKEYKGKITLQDNFTSIISKAIKQTQQLQKEFSEIEKLKANPKISVSIDKKTLAYAKEDLSKLEKNKVKVKAALDSSFHSTMNTIDRATAQNKTIKIKAEETVTRTVKNLQRDIFTMERQLKTSILSGGKVSGGFSGNITTSSPDIVSTLTSGFNRVLKTTNNTSKGSGGTSVKDNNSFIQDVASNSLGTAAAMSAAGVTAASMKSFIKANKVEIETKEVENENEKTLKPTITNAIKAGFKDALTRSRNRAQNLMDDGEALRDADFGFETGKHVYDGKSEFAKLIRGQKQQMADTRAKYGLTPNSNYLSKYVQKTFNKTHHPDELDIEFTGVAKRISKTQLSISQAMAKMQNDIKWRRAAISVDLERIFNSGVLGKIKNGVNKVIGNITVLGQSIGHTIQRGAYHASTSIGSLALKFFGEGSKMRKTITGVGSAIKVMLGKATTVSSVFGKWTNPLNLVLKSVNKVGTAIGKIASKAARVTFNIVGNALKTSAQILSNVTKAIAAAAGGLVFKGVMDGAQIEQYEVSMLHFIKNAGGTAQDRDKYINNAIQLANKTPFSTNEVLEAANRGIGVAGGDTTLAADLLKLSANMAALTPGKSVMDAMEALADLRLGERERMKEFGFKIDNDEFVKAAGLSEGNIADLTPEQMEKAFQTLTNTKTGSVGKYFDGGAEKISQTFKGQMSTLTGQIGSTFADLGRVITQPFIEPLKLINEKLSGFSAKMKDFKDGVLGGTIPNPFTEWQDFLSWAGKGVNMHNPIAQFALAIAPAVQTATSFLDMLKESFNNVSDRIKASLDKIIAPFSSLFDGIGEKAPWAQGILDIFANVVTNALEMAGSAFENGYEIIKPILEWIGEHSEQINSIITFMGELFQMACELISSAFQILWPIIEPILSGLINFLAGISDYMIKDFPEAAKAVDKFGKDVGKALSGVCDWFGTLFDKISNSYTKLKDFLGLEDGLKNFSWDKIGMDKSSDNSKNNNNNSKKSNNGRAVGQAYVPYNGYQASLHRGEAILTRQEADAWRAGRVGNDTTAATGKTEITINVHGTTDADAVAKRIVSEIRRAVPNM